MCVWDGVQDGERLGLEVGAMPSPTRAKGARHGRSRALGQEERVNPFLTCTR